MPHNICSRRPYVSIIIPAKNEARRLPASLEKIADYLSTKTESAEILVVDNGSTDGTGEVVRCFAESHPSLSISLVTEGIPGKGAAVRRGMLAAKGEYLFQCDADLSMPIEELDKLLHVTVKGRDVAIGSRAGQGPCRLRESLHRWLMGRIFNRLVQSLGLTGLSDTQCGFKVYRRNVARELFSAQTIPGWGFDVEILALARHRGYSIASVPIRWFHDSDSRVRPIRDGFAMLCELWSLRHRLRSGFYRRRIASLNSIRLKSVFKAPTSSGIQKLSGSC